MRLKKIDISEVKPGDKVRVYNLADSVWLTHVVEKVSRHGRYVVLHDRKGTFYRDVPGGPQEMFLVASSGAGIADRMPGRSLMTTASDAPRPSCPMCVRKHLGQAAVLFQEALQGYPQHLWLAIGHLAEGESESQQDFPGFAALLRAERKKAESGVCVPDCVGLLSRFDEMAGGSDIAERVASRFMRSER